MAFREKLIFQQELRRFVPVFHKQEVGISVCFKSELDGNVFKRRKKYSQIKCFIQACTHLAVRKGHFIEKKRMCFVSNQTQIFSPHHGIFQFSYLNSLSE